jgi:hypothetical protein
MIHIMAIVVATMLLFADGPHTVNLPLMANAGPRAGRFVPGCAVGQDVIVHYQTTGTGAIVSIAWIGIWPTGALVSQMRSVPPRPAGVYVVRHTAETDRHWISHITWASTTPVSSITIACGG